ncbi:MAG TPA: hypothetical protein DDZ51_03985 [Planctomycetaceae bacterium]|nr:hypothetical protein [Planctomycetaceae bacterium]
MTDHCSSVGRKSKRKRLIQIVRKMASTPPELSAPPAIFWPNCRWKPLLLTATVTIASDGGTAIPPVAQK